MNHEIPALIAVAVLCLLDCSHSNPDILPGSHLGHTLPRYQRDTPCGCHGCTWALPYHNHCVLAKE